MTTQLPGEDHRLIPTMELGPRQQRALEAICDTLASGGEELPAASEIGVPAALVEAVGMNPRAAQRKQVAQLLSLWDTALLTALGGGGLRRFSALPHEKREEVLLSWCDSRLHQRRAAFQALRKGALLLYYMLPGPNGGRNEAWAAIGYPGPLGPPENPRPKTLTTLPIERDAVLDCDVCIVGSGAGGGTAAAALAAAGLDIVVLEAGDYFDDADFDGSEAAGYRRLYLEGGTAATVDQSVSLLAGACLGGGTVVNYTFAFRTPDEVREEWARQGIPAFVSDEYTRSLDAVWARLGVTLAESRPSRRDEVLRRGLEALGWHVETAPRSVRGCEQGAVCGYCGFGCQLGAKQSTVKTWLADAQEAGARILVRTRAERVLVDGASARGVEARSRDGHRVTIRSRAVVAACGALHTPALLKRSGLENANIGKHLHLHPVTAVIGQFDEEIQPWEGTLAGLYSDEHRDLDAGYGVKYEHTATHPSLLIAFSPWRSSRHHAELVRALPRVVGLGVVLRDRDSGEVRVGRDGEPVARYRLADYDVRHVRVGLDGAAQILEAAGARRIYSSHAKSVAYEPARGERRERFLHDADACGYEAGRCVFYSFHLMGSARMGGSPTTSVCNPEGETWEIRDLYVWDGSAFPSAPGVNPMVPIEAIAHMNASQLAARLT